MAIEGLKQKIRHELERHQNEQKQLEKEVKQKYYDSMTEQQHVAQAYAVKSAIVGIYENILVKLDEVTKQIQEIFNKRIILIPRKYPFLTMKSEEEQATKELEEEVLAVLDGEKQK